MAGTLQSAESEIDAVRQRLVQAEAAAAAAKVVATVAAEGTAAAEAAVVAARLDAGQARRAAEETYVFSG